MKGSIYVSFLNRIDEEISQLKPGCVELAHGELLGASISVGFALSNRVRRYQLDISVTNEGSTPLHDVKLSLVPPAVALQIWNVVEDSNAKQASMQVWQSYKTLKSQEL